ncbi:MAG: gamma-glutamyltransferase family protein [Alphaproteobacteria bacterium]|nr:gamma-glutamyltransferase family protein [Alphaproteobacteria bacterium]
MRADFTTRPELVGSFGMVSSTHWLASAVGMSMLELGGNAFDAAVAVGFTLQIVEPHLNGPGGDVPIIFQRADSHEPTVLCGQGVAPKVAAIDHFRELGLKLVPGTGLLPAVVPGSFGAWMLLLRDHGTLPLRTVLEPAIGYAQNGFPLLPETAQTIEATRDLFIDAWPSSAGIWLPNGQAPLSGGRFSTPSIADTYRRILEEAEGKSADREEQIETARSTFYQGFVAEAIDRFCRAFEALDSSGRRHRGLLSGDDLAAWQASYEPTLALDYAGYRVHKTGPWGQGPVFLQQLALLSGFDLANMDPLGDRFVHTIVECAKLAFADRDVFYGDPAFADVPIKTLLSPEHNERRRRLVGEEASEQMRPSDLPGAAERLEALLHLSGVEDAAEIGGGEPTFADIGAPGGDTCHLDVVDRFGNLVSATPSGGWLQSSPAVPGLGFNLTTRGQMFWLDETQPSSLAPGKRPRTTLTPTLITKDGRPWIGMGTPGGDQQDQWTLTVLLHHLHHAMNMQAAIDCPIFHSVDMISSFHPRGREPNRIAIEKRFPEMTINALEKRGHQIDRETDWSLGKVCAAGVRKDGLLRAAATPRLMQAYAIGR